MAEFLQAIIDYISQIKYLEASGLIFGLLAVYFLIKNNIWTWPAGIAYVIVSLFIFYDQRLYADFGLHIFFFVLNVYGWWYWIYGAKNKADKIKISTMSVTQQLIFWLASIPCIFLMGYLLETYSPDPALPYWDSSTTTLSLFGMWLTARKKIENWHFWFVVDILATGIYFHKGIYFFSALYLFYIGMAVSGYISWKKIMDRQSEVAL